MKKKKIIKKIKEKPYKEKQTFIESYTKKKFIILLLSLPIPLILSLIAFFFGAQSTTVIAISSLGLIAVIIPYIALSFFEFRDIKNAEEGYPLFLRDLSQSVSAGMTIPQAIKVTSDTHYGSLSKYIRKLHIWISWSTPFPKAWVKFTKTLEKSELIRKINGLILESFHAGGDIKVTLNSLAEDVTLLKQMESQKKSLLNQQIIIMYIVYFIFLGVVIGLFNILAPILFIQKMGLLSGITVKAASETLSLEYFKNLFFLMVLVESICAGVIAGQIAEEKVIAGFKHIIIMMSVGVFCFFVFIYPSSLSMEMTLYPSVVNVGSTVSISGRVYYESSPAAGASINIISPNKEVYTLFADNIGEFRRDITAPMQPGTYSVVATVQYQDDKQAITQTFTVR